MSRGWPIPFLAAAIVAAPTAFAQGFAAMVTPPRFELTVKPGHTTRQVVELYNRSAAQAGFLVRTADWTLSRDFGVDFQTELQPGSCRPWVALERPEINVPGSSAMRYRFEVAVPADAPSGECRFALLIDGAEPVRSTGGNVSVPINGRIGVIVYVEVGDAKPDLAPVGPAVSTVNGRRVPAMLVRNSGNAHGRMGGFLHGTDANGLAYDFTPSDFPILPGDERDVFLTPSTPTDEQPTLTYPVHVQGNLEWNGKAIPVDQTFE